MIAFQRNSRSLVSILAVLASAVAMSAQSQTGDQSTLSVTQLPEAAALLPEQATRQLQDKLKTSPVVSLEVVAVDAAPLEISAAHARSLKIEGNYDASSAPVSMINDYVVDLTFSLVNRSDGPVTGAVLEVTNTQEKHTFSLSVSHEMKKDKAEPLNISVGESKKIRIPFMFVTGDPAFLSLELTGARFADGRTWGSFPFAAPRRPPAQTQAFNASAPGGSAPAISAPVLPVPAAPSVDSKPRLTNSPQPRYTEAARRDHVMGTVRARILVGTDGAVKQVMIVNALPDGLTEQAIRAAYEMKFDPARKNGEPAAYWMPVEIEFNLK